MVNFVILSRMILDINDVLAPYIMHLSHLYIAGYTASMVTAKCVYITQKKFIMCTVREY